MLQDECQIYVFRYNGYVNVGPFGRRKPHQTTGVWLSETQMSNSAVCSRPESKTKLIYRGVAYQQPARKAQLKK